jgi:hypothetical protein
MQGDKITEQGISRTFKAKLQPAQLRRPWRAQFVLSTAPRGRLPPSVAKENDVKTLCIVEAMLSNVSRKVKNRHWWNFGVRYELALFDIKLIPGPADLKFQLWNDNKLINSDDDSIEVKWDAAVRNLSIPELEELNDMQRA